MTPEEKELVTIQVINYLKEHDWTCLNLTQTELGVPDYICFRDKRYFFLYVANELSDEQIDWQKDKGYMQVAWVNSLQEIQEGNRYI